MTSADGRLRLTLLGGYLGSGKTTWLRHQLHSGFFGRVHVIVNEAAGTPVDDALLAQAHALTLLSGGCACCDGRDALRDILLDLCDRRSATGQGDARLDQIVLETSGLADPGAILSVIHDHPILTRQIVVTETIVVVDALNALDQLRHEGLSRAQIETADRLIVTKSDMADPGALADLIATLRVVAPGAAQSAAVFGSVTSLPDIAPDHPPTGLPNLSSSLAPIRPMVLALGDTPDWTAFTVWLSALLYAHGDALVRVKGVVRTPAGRLLLQTVRRTVQAPEILPDTDCATDNAIAIIGRGFSQPELERALQRFVDT